MIIVMTMIKKMTAMKKIRVKSDEEEDMMEKRMTFLTDKKMTRIRTGGDSLTRDSVPAKLMVKDAPNLVLTWYHCEVGRSIVEASPCASHKANIHPCVPSTHPSVENIRLELYSI